MKSAAELAALVRPGQSIYVGGGLAPPGAFVEALQADPALTRDVRILSTITPGFPNPFDFAKLHPTATLTGPLMVAEFSAAQREGRFRQLPASFSQFLRYLGTQTFDLGVVQVAPPDANGRYSLGPNVEFQPAALKQCRRIAVVVNPLLPSMPNAVSLGADEIAAMCESASAIPQYLTETDEPTDAIGRHIADLIGDGSTIQTGIGKVPSALAKHLSGHRNLKIYSGMVSDGVLELAKAGALDDGADHRMAVIAGSQALYDWLPRAKQQLSVVGCAGMYTNEALAKLEQFVSVNSALEVDLLGQCNLEHLSGRAISGAGGAPDFAGTARTCRGGISVVALNATFGRVPQSRIVSTLSPGAVVSLSRLDVDVVVTEFGVADMRVASVHERAKALIGVAAPQFREELERAWAATAAKL
ncbi:acetyl-CoA hydrolase/transferase family protein [Ramlibacter sp.]|uniref:acetyl-CoA hydrolase/transferase family protein n=1 Tax=Ramlibacter sp. TaxID=1917967 RepID=UPI003D0D00E9